MFFNYWFNKAVRSFIIKGSQLGEQRDPAEAAD